MDSVHTFYFDDLSSNPTAVNLQFLALNCCFKRRKIGLIRTIFKESVMVDLPNQRKIYLFSVLLVYSKYTFS